MNKKSIDFENLFLKTVYILFKLMIITILIICIIFSYIDYLCKRNYFPNIFLLCTGIWFFIFLIYITLKISNKVQVTKQKKDWIYLFSMLFFIFQIFLVYNYHFLTNWDVNIIRTLCTAVAHNEDISTFSDYFSIYPYNLFICFVFKWIMKIGHLIGLHNYEYFLILVFQCFLSTLTGVLLYRFLKHYLSNSVISIIGYICYILLIGLSPWVSIPYSDSTGLVFPILILNIYTWLPKNKKMHIFKWILISFLTYTGFKIKPQIMILLIAIVIIEFITNIKNKFYFNIKQHNVYFGGFVLGFIISIFIVSISTNSLHLEIDHEKSFSMTHFFMMGMNTTRMGIYSSEDVAFSKNFETYQERVSANIEESISRIQSMGIFGFIKQMVRKTLINCNDGTFAWGIEGGFYKTVLAEKNNTVSPFIRNIYYNSGKYYKYYSNFVHIVWITIVFFMLFSSVSKNNKTTSVIMLAIIGDIIFQLLFEARARYLYVYAPIFIVLAMNGMDFIYKKYLLKILKN